MLKVCKRRGRRERLMERNQIWGGGDGGEGEEDEGDVQEEEQEDAHSREETNMGRMRRMGSGAKRRNY